MKFVELQNEDGEEISDDFRFEPVKAGEEVVKTFYMANLTDKTVQDISFKVDGENVDLVDAPEKISGNSRQQVKVKLAPSENKITPINAEIDYRGKIIAE